MNSDFFLEMNRQTETRFWINNPSMNELEKAIQHGAVNCTTNPAYCARLLSVESDYMQSVIDEAVGKIKDYDEIAVYVYKRATKRLMDRYMPLYKKSNGKEGFVTLQDDPQKDEDAAYMSRNVMRNRILGENYMAKIPVIRGGIEAIDFCVQEDVPVCATEVFSISQARCICETYLKASRKSGKKPLIFITHISGIFDEYLGKIAKNQGIRIDPSVLNQAGIAIARKEYALLTDLGFKLLGGGARDTHHFLELVGGNAHITINWSTAEEIIKTAGQITNTIEKETSVDVIAELREKFPDFRKAYDEDGLAISEFSGYGPVQLFRNAFLKGWYLLLSQIASRKNNLAV